ITVGNHDIEAGRNVFSRVYRQMEMPVLSANVVHESSGEPFFIPYHVFRRKGYKIAVLGMLTPQVTWWVPEWLRPGMDFHSITESARYWIPLIQENEKPDLLIGLFHTGARAETPGPPGNENAVLWIAQNVPGIDLICYGHDHKAGVQYVLNTQSDTVWLINPGAHGKKLAQARVILHPGKQQKARITAELTDLDRIEPDTDYLEAFEPFFRKTQQYGQKPIAVLLHTLESRVAMDGPSRWLDEVHRGQLEIAGADSGIRPDVSFASAIPSDAVIEKGQLYVKDFFTWFPYENSLCILEMTGHEIRQYLEYSCTRTLGINFDTAAGILYTIQRNRPEGQRIEIHSMADGQAFIPQKKYRVVMNSYRAQGGGGHLFDGLGWDESVASGRLIWVSRQDMRTLFMQWEASRSLFSADLLNHWN
ncbi:MAG: 5'-nucleotidase C-terminal domain-containing protein, partial [Bacteroidales bacterium]|nr:5'-nucleotidase C-terminal domain-containing protein [Bacteroidales bacterium]